MARLTANSEPRSNREANILQVASIIADNWHSGIGRDRPVAEWAAGVNDGDGWNFDCRYPGNQYIGDADWTRVEGKRLSEGDLLVAIGLAQNMMAQDWDAEMIFD